MHASTSTCVVVSTASPPLPFLVCVCTLNRVAFAPISQAGRNPVKIVGNTIFLYVTVGSLYAVAVSQGNAQAALAFQFLHEFIKVLKGYFGDFTEDSLRNNFVLIYEVRSMHCTRLSPLHTQPPFLFLASSSSSPQQARIR